MASTTSLASSLASPEVPTNQPNTSSPSSPATAFSPTAPQTSQNPEVPANFDLLTSEDLGDEIVLLYVGTKRKKFTVHKKLLCDRSTFFSKGFQGQLQEAAQGEMHLPEDNPAAVTLLVNFLYRGTLPEGNAKSHSMRDLYYFAEKIFMDDLMDKVIDIIQADHRRMGQHVGDVAILDIYKKTHNRSKLRAYAVSNVSNYLLNHNKEWCTGYFGRLKNCPDFFTDFFHYQVKHLKENALKLKSSNFNTRDYEPCEFHSHKNPEDCYLHAAK